MLEDRRAALIAAAVMASQPMLWLASVRSMPDALLCLTLLVSAYGFGGLLAAGRREARFYWAAYGGAGLALATKGMIAPVFVALMLAWATWIIRRERALRWRDLWHPSALAGAVVGGAGYAAMVWQHGMAGGLGFWHDQTAGPEHRPGMALGRIAQYVALYGLYFAPWLWLAVDLAWRRRRGAMKPPKPPAEPLEPPDVAESSDALPAGAAPEVRRRRFTRLALSWALLLPLLFGCGPRVDARYLLPATPWLAVLLADQFRRADPQVLAALAGRLLVTVLALAGVLGAGGFLLHWQLGTPGMGATVLAVQRQ